MATIIQPDNTVSLPAVNKRSSSDTPNVPVGGHLTMQEVVLKEPLRAMTMRAMEKKQMVNGALSPDAFVPDVHSAFWSLP